MGPNTACPTTKNKQSIAIKNFNRHFCDLGVVRRIYIFLGLLIQCLELTALFSGLRDSFSWKDVSNKDKTTHEAMKMKEPRNPNLFNIMPLNMLLTPSDTNIMRSMIAK